MQDRLKNDPAYRRLKSSSLFLFGHVSYWLASDHLLLVDVVGFVERYRQFRLSDIELVLIRPTRLRLILGLIAASAAVPLVLGAAWLWFQFFSTTDSDWQVGAVIVSILAVIASTVLAWIVAGGPMCQTRLVTGVQQVRLPGMFRLRRAEALAAALHAQAVSNGPTPAPTTPPTTGPGPGTIPAPEGMPSQTS